MLLPLLVAAIACGNAPVESISLGQTVVELHAGQDAGVADQVRRVLPRAVRAAGRWGAVPPKVILSIHATHAELELATGRSGNAWMRAWARSGMVDLQSPRTWSRGWASDDALFQILAHELTHCVLFQAVGREGRVRDVPIWFQEGMATVTAGERHAAIDAGAVSTPAAYLRSDPRVVYGTADRAFRDLVTRFGDGSIRRLLSRLGEGQDFPAAFRDATGVALTEFERDLTLRLAAVAANG